MNNLMKNSQKHNGTKKPFYKKWWFWVIVVVIVISIGAGSARNGNSSKDTDNKETTTVSTRKAKKKVSAKAYKNNCKTLSFKDLSRNPDKHKGEKLKYTGKVIQVQEDEHWLDDNTTVDLRINVTKDEYGLWDDTIFATVELPKNADRILEDDIITMPKINIEYYSVKSK